MARRLAVPLIIAAVAVLTRAVTFGNPVVIVDDQFYLLVGDAMLDGAWPYIDIWDRKPPGLFLLFGAIAAIGGSSVVAMQLIATAFAAATALLIHRLARLFVDERSALLGALAYLPMLPLLGGQGGQSPIFYNLPMAGAALLLFAAAGRSDGALTRHALGAMLLCGLAMSIKPVAAVEGAACGVAFLWLMRRRGHATPALAVRAAAMVGVALLPVLLLFLPYALRGEEAAGAFLYANVESIFDKQSLGPDAKLAGIGFLALYAAPLFLLAAVGAWRCRSERHEPVRAKLLLGWLGAAVAGYLAVPSFFDHYALPMLVPLCVAASIAFARAAGPAWAGGLLAFCLIQGAILDERANRWSSAIFADLAARVNEARHGGCIYLADGPPWLYRASGACRLTPYVFPDHLNLEAESEAIGVDPRAELARVLNERPAVIVTQDSEKVRHNPDTQALLERALARHYRPVHLVPADAPPMLATVRLWQRRDLAPPPHANGGDLSLF